MTQSSDSGTSPAGRGGQLLEMGAGETRQLGCFALLIQSYSSSRGRGVGSTKRGAATTPDH